MIAYLHKRKGGENMKKVLKIVGIIIAVVLVLFMIHAIRNYIILSKINENVAKYVESNNMHMRITSKQMTLNYYRKDDKEVAILQKDNVKISNCTSTKYS